MSKGYVLDLFCCQGGASEGYRQAGFTPLGVDKTSQPRYPFPFIERDALDVVRELLYTGSVTFPEGLVISRHEVVLVHASPPCQARTAAQKIRGNEHPNLISPTRFLLQELGIPYVIENVVFHGDYDPDPLQDATLLCGSMFGIQTYRHRLFETNWGLEGPHHPEHVAKTTKMGRPPVDGEYMHIVGNFSGVDRAREIMGMPWATQSGLREAIPPVYTKYVGEQFTKAG